MYLQCDIFFHFVFISSHSWLVYLKNFLVKADMLICYSRH